MQADLHDSMRHIIDRSLAGEASPQEQQSVREHLRECAPCQKYANVGRRAIASLSGFSFAADQGLQAKVHAALDLRIQQLQATRPNGKRIVQVSIAALLLTIVGSFGALQVGGPLATVLHLHPAQTQAGLFALWILPSWGLSLMLPALLLFSVGSADRKGQTL
jgi:anti-sigma factor RsiW